MVTQRGIATARARVGPDAARAARTHFATEFFNTETRATPSAGWVAAAAPSDRNLTGPSVHELRGAVATAGTAGKGPQRRQDPAAGRGDRGANPPGDSSDATQRRRRAAPAGNGWRGTVRRQCPNAQAQCSTGGESPTPAASPRTSAASAADSPPPPTGRHTPGTGSRSHSAHKRVPLGDRIDRSRLG